MIAKSQSPTRRPIEREYLATLNEAVPLDTWRAICKRAADDAAGGDAKARDWLSKWLLGVETRLLTILAAEESEGESVAVAADGAIAEQRERIENKRITDETNRVLFESLHSLAGKG